MPEIPAPTMMTSKSIFSGSWDMMKVQNGTEPKKREKKKEISVKMVQTGVEDMG
jgi:hypothetical protein